MFDMFVVCSSGVSPACMACSSDISVEDCRVNAIKTDCAYSDVCQPNMYLF